MPRPTVLFFDVLQTLFSLEALRPQMQGLGLPPEALEIWFARVLRDGFALTAAGDFRPFPEVAVPVLAGLLAEHRLTPDGEAVRSVLGAITDLPAEPDVAPAFALLRDQGVRIFLLGNGGKGTVAAQLRKNGLEETVEGILSVDEVQCWKPRREAYLFAADRAGVALSEAALVAAHPWDVHGAQRAGMRGAWVRRHEALYSPALGVPDVQGDTLTDVVEKLLR